MDDFTGARPLPVGGLAPEDVVVDAAGDVFTGLADGRVVRLRGGQGPVETVARLPGCPLGLELLGAGELLVCASDAGLLAVSLDGGEVRTLADRFAGRRLGAVNNAAVADDGTICFSDSSVRFPVPRRRDDHAHRRPGVRRHLWLANLTGDGVPTLPAPQPAGDVP